MRHGIDLVYDKELLKQGVKYYHRVDINQHPGIATIGASGSGKTQLNKLIIARFSIHTIGGQTTVLDFKNEDYKDFTDCERLYTFRDCYDGLKHFYEEFLERQSGKSTARGFRFLVIEELASMLAYYDKKVAENIKNMIATIILMGRSYSMQVLVSTQRPDATLFAPGVRDSISTTIALGNLSKEGQSMLFKGFEDKIIKVYGPGAGYMLSNGSQFHQIQAPLAKDVHKLNDYIRKALT